MPWDPNAPPNPIYYTREHRAARRALLAAYTPGDPCCICGHPMWPLPNGKTSNLHADHDPGTNQYRGLAHGNPTPCPTCNVICNQTDGARRARARQNVTTLDW